ncbi:MAG TPA: DUF3047 domain-containing protein [Desulfatiglandales bacterium]|nr:DUF3047 domain-containing protein [Desulfatiglandales bacterium]
MITRSVTFWIYLVILGVLLALLTPSKIIAKNLLLGFKQGNDSDLIPEGWELITYAGTPKNKMSTYVEEKRTVIKMESLGSASGILKRQAVDLKEFPVLAWRWKINRVVGMAIESRKDRNDSAARVRVIFGKERGKHIEWAPEISKFLKSLGLQINSGEPKGFKIDYIWGSNVHKGHVFDYPGSKNHKIIVVESGNERTNKWIWEKQDLIKDFRQFFGGIPHFLTGALVLTDTDDTNEGVTAYYSSFVMMNK